MALRFDTDRDDYEFGAILGLVKIDRCYDPKTHPITDAPSSVWYNKGDVAWIMTQAHEFDTPIKLDANDKMQTQVRLANRPQYKKKLADAIRDLRDDYDQELLMLPSKTLVFTQKSKRARVQKRALS